MLAVGSPACGQHTTSPMSHVIFFAQGEPKPQPRPRAFARNMGGGKFSARVYEAGTAEGWKSMVAMAAKPHLPKEPFTDPLSVQVDFYLPRPKAHMSSNGLFVKASSPSHPMNKMDCDNLAKAVLDTLTQIGMWKDDGQIVSLCVSKNYATERSGASVEISPL
jgi:Holliday junction resolvase RusA-like endonuclease